MIGKEPPLFPSHLTFWSIGIIIFSFQSVKGKRTDVPGDNIRFVTFVFVDICFHLLCFPSIFSLSPQPITQKPLPFPPPLQSSHINPLPYPSSLIIYPSPHPFNHLPFLFPINPLPFLLSIISSSPPYRFLSLLPSISPLFPHLLNPLPSSSILNTETKYEGKQIDSHLYSIMQMLSMVGSYVHVMNQAGSTALRNVYC